MVVGIDFRKFLRIACVESLLVVPLDDDENGQKWCGFPVSSRFGCPELVDASELTLKLGSARGELRGSGSGKRQPGRGGMVVHEEGRSVWGFHELGFVSLGQINGSSGPWALHGVEASLVWLQERRHDSAHQQIARVA